jgi:hypothetical protein
LARPAIEADAMDIDNRNSWRDIFPMTRKLSQRRARDAVDARHHATGAICGSATGAELRCATMRFGASPHYGRDRR